MHYRHYLLWGLAVTLSFATVTEVEAQLIPDNTLGKENSLVNSVNSLQKQINGGAIRGSNLFHSFKEFNIGGGQSVYFSNPTAIQNILTRVTGNNSSSILGKLGVLGNANLFLINPNGIIFGENASLDISGSFTATTSESILFDNGWEFSATNPEAPPLLMVNITPGLQNPHTPQADITNQGNLVVGEDLTISGENLNLTGSFKTGRDLKLQASHTLLIRENPSWDTQSEGVTNPFIADAGRDLLLRGNQAIDIFALNHPSSGLFSGGDLILQSSTPIVGDARYFSGGSFRIEQLDGGLGDLEISNDPIIGTNGGNAGQIQITTRGHVSANEFPDSPSDYANQFPDSPSDYANPFPDSPSDYANPFPDFPSDDGNPFPDSPSDDGNPFPDSPSDYENPFPDSPSDDGNPFPDSPSDDGNPFPDSLSDYGNEGAIIRASGDVSFDSYTGGSLHILAGGSVNITGDVIIRNADGENGLQETVTLSSGGSLEIDGKNQATLDIRAGTSAFGTPGITGSRSFIPGNPNTGESPSSSDIVIGGNIRVNSADGLVFLTNQYKPNNSLSGGNILVEGNINTSSTSGNGGRIFIDAKGDISTLSLDSSYSPSLLERSNGNGGAITLYAGGDISTSNLNSSSSALKGNGGAITLYAGGDISTSNLNSFLCCPLSTGDGGAITLNAGGDISTSNLNSYSLFDGNGGAITLDASGDIKTSDLYSVSWGGNGGAVLLESNNSITVNSIITSSDKKSGDIQLKTKTGLLRLTNSFISTNAEDNGNGGDIYLQAPSIELTQTDITSTAPGSGKSGDISLESDNLIYLDNSRLLTALEPGSTGKGGNIEIDAQKLQLENFSLIDTGTYSTGNAGNVKVRVQDISLDNNSSILSLTTGGGNAGNINLQVADMVYLTNQSKIATAATSSSTGNGGDIDITSNSFFLLEGSQLLALTQGTGSSGNINLDVGNTVDINGIANDGSLSGIFTSSEGINSAKGGDITIGTSNLNITDGGVLSAQTFSQSDGGNITVNAHTVSLQNGGQMLTNTFGVGRAGSITVNATGNLNIAGVDSEFENRPTPNTSGKQKVSVNNYDCGLFGECKLPEQEPNNSIETAQKIAEENFSIHSLGFSNYNVEFSTRIPYVSVGATGDNSVDYYAIEVKKAGTRAVFDLDYFAGDFSPDLDTKMTLFDNQGNKFVSNDNSSDKLGAGGSDSNVGGLDPYIRYTFTEPGTYFIKVDQVDGSGIPNNVDYELQISLEAPSIATSTVNSGAASGIFAGTEGTGSAGNIEINTPLLNIGDKSKGHALRDKPKGHALRDRAQVTVSSKGNSSAGNLFIDALAVNIENGAKISAETESGTGGNIQFKNLESLRLNQHSQISASTIDGTAGDVKINSTDLIQLHAGSTLESEATGNGNAGNLTVSTQQLTLRDNSKASVSSQGDGTAGLLSISSNTLNLDNQAQISAQTVSGTGGNIKLQDLESLRLNQHSQISASTVDGQAGDVGIHSTDLIQLHGGSTLESEATGNGNAGNLTVSTQQLTLRDNSKASVSSQGDGTAGNLLINATDVNLSQNAKISATTESGIGGDISLGNLNSLKLNHSEISASTIKGKAGNLNIDAANSVELIGNGGLSVEASQGGTAGSLKVNTNKFTISDEAQVSVSSPSGQAGNLEITADDLFLNQGKLTAETGFAVGNVGANITLDIKDLLIMNNNSLISAQAYDTANGGNITIINPQGFIIGLPFENSDITANATQGNGGNINITTQNIFGLVFRQQRTSLSDITASSQFGLSGQVTVNQLNVNPATGLVELPSTLVGTTQIKAGCAASGEYNFVISGRGGLPQSPWDLFNGRTTVTQLFDLVPPQEVASHSSSENNLVKVDNQKNKIVEATGWINDADGNVIFVAKIPENHSQHQEISSVSCEDFSSLSQSEK